MQIWWLFTIFIAVSLGSLESRAALCSQVLNSSLDILASNKLIRKMPELDPQLLEAINDYRIARANLRESDTRLVKQTAARRLLLIAADRRLVSVLNARAKSEGKYLIASMNREFVGEDLETEPVEYDQTRAQWKSHRLKVRKGKIYDSSGNLFDTQDAEHIDTGIAKYWVKAEGTAIFVMDRDGNVYADKFPVTGYRHHSSLIAGTPSASAGEIKVVNGVPKHINSKSKHYPLSRALNEQVLKWLKASGVQIQPEMVDFWD